MGSCSDLSVAVSTFSRHHIKRLKKSNGSRMLGGTMSSYDRDSKKSSCDSPFVVRASRVVCPVNIPRRIQERNQGRDLTASADSNDGINLEDVDLDVMDESDAMKMTWRITSCHITHSGCDMPPEAGEAHEEDDARDEKLTPFDADMFVGDELFFGQDRLDFVREALLADG